MGDAPAARREQFRFAVPGQLHQNRIDGEHTAIGGDETDADRGVFIHRPETRLGFRDLLLCGFLLGDVLDQADDIERPARLVAHQGEVDAAPEEAAVLAEVALLHQILIALARHELLKQLAIQIAVFRHHQVGRIDAGDLFGGVTGEPFRSGVDLHDAAVEGHHGHAHRGVVEHRAKAGGGLGQGRALALLLVNVLDQGHQVRGLALRVAHQGKGEPRPEDLAVLAQVTSLHAVIAELPFQHLGEAIHAHLRIGRIDVLAVVALQQLRFGET